MRTREREVIKETKEYGLIRLVLIVISLVIVWGLWLRESSRSLVEIGARYHLLLISEGGARVSLASFDPVEQKTILIEFPSELLITSRSVGMYSVGDLYQLGKYRDGGGLFVRQKIQGFLKLPITGYLVNPGSGESRELLRGALIKSFFNSKYETNLSYKDRLILMGEYRDSSSRVIGKEELLRAGILEPAENGWGYNAARLSGYVGGSLFDWKVGQEGATVAIVNESGLDGMGSDFAEFVQSMGMDVVSVRSGSNVEEQTRIRVEDPAKVEKALKRIAQVFDFEPYEVGENTQQRADIVFWVGRDALELF